MKKPLRCGGWNSYDGPCGATDCVDCYPGQIPVPEEEEDYTPEFEQLQEMDYRDEEWRDRQRATTFEFSDDGDLS